MAGGIQLGYSPYHRKATALDKCLRNTTPQEKKKDICSINITPALIILLPPLGKQKIIKILYKINSAK